MGFFINTSSTKDIRSNNKEELNNLQLSVCCGGHRFEDDEEFVKQTDSIKGR